jgi:transcriptional regulator with XRE-family HTH domain
MIDQPTKQQVHEHIGKRLCRRRSDLGLSLEEVAAVVGVSSHQAHRYEAGTAAMSAPRPRVLASMLGVSPAYFYQPTLRPDHAGAPLSAGS